MMISESAGLSAPCRIGQILGSGSNVLRRRSIGVTSPHQPFTWPARWRSVCNFVTSTTRIEAIRRLFFKHLRATELSFKACVQDHRGH